jgi:hypothetical protein
MPRNGVYVCRVAAKEKEENSDFIVGKWKRNILVAVLRKIPIEDPVKQN